MLCAELARDGMANMSKVKNGIYKRGDSWYILYRIDNQQFRKRCGTTKVTAELALAKIKENIAIAKMSDDWSGLETLVTPKSRKTFVEAAESYMEERAQHKASTVITYRDILDSHLLPEFKDTQIPKIDEESIAKFQSRLLRRNLSPRRVNNIIQLLRSILKVCVRRKVIKENPADSVDRVTEPKTDIDPLSRDELDLALSKVDTFFRPLFICLAWTGARPNELIALRWQDIDWRRGDFKISKGRVRGQEGLPKTKSAERFVSMLPPVVDALKELDNRPVKNIDGYIFTTKKGEPINKHLDRIWASALKRAGLRHRPSYQLRHTFASLALEQGVSPGWVSKILGHGSMEITFRYYARFIDDATNENQKLMVSMFDQKISISNRE